jgi:hypothetical protein
MRKKRKRGGRMGGEKREEKGRGKIGGVFFLRVHSGYQ